VCGHRLSASEFWNVLAVVARDEVLEKPGPTGLVRRPEPLPCVGMEIFVEQQKILPKGERPAVPWDRSQRHRRE
jgi:hypothetical protein